MSLFNYNSMTIVFRLPQLITAQYRCLNHLNLYNSSACQELATQAARGRQLKFLSTTPVDGAIQVQLCEDGYIAWLSLEQLSELEEVQDTYQPLFLPRLEIEKRLPEVIAFTKMAMTTPNYYLWGGTIGPNFDCSGLIQTAFANSGIWLPRDSYQQEAFTQSITYEELLPGDLIFFGNERVNHIALYLGDNNYIHSSGREMGRNGIGIDTLSENGDEVSQQYYQKLWSFGRVMQSYRRIDNDT